MERILQLTDDGSHTIAIPEMNVTYHSKFGAVRESQHVFIKTGLDHLLNTLKTPILSVFEMGFGTGLNALLTLQYAIEKQQKIFFQSIELSPLQVHETEGLNYQTLVPSHNELKDLHSCNWEEDIVLNDYFTLHKTCGSLINFNTGKQFHLVYYDAFAPDVQPELWTKGIFEKLYAMLLPKCILVTYCSKGDVRRIMMAVGFKVKRLPGPPGKIHILRAEKPANSF